MLKNHQVAIGKIYLVAGLSLLLMTGSFYLFGFKPLSDRIHAEHASEIKHFLHTNRWLLYGVIQKHHDLAQQSASRTAIRKRQAAYLLGKVTLDALIAFSQPKLSDALRANEELVGIARFGPKGELLYSTGLQLPEGIASQCDLAGLEKIVMLNPVQVGDKRLLFYCSPIVDRDSGRVGADILIMKEDAIKRIVDDSPGNDSKQMIIGVASGDNIIYWPDTLDDLQAHGVLEEFIRTGEARSGYIILTDALGYSDWKLYAVINAERFFAEVDRQLLFLLVVIAGLAVTFFIMTVLALRPVIRSLLYEQQLFEMSHRDSLTGLFNHAYMEELLDNEVSRSRRHGRTLSVLMFDIDHFKRVNDTYGHQAGDDVLRNIAAIVQDSVREHDVVARYGGEEFMLILPETDSNGASILAERLRVSVEEMRVKTGDSEMGVTVSIGICCYDGSAGEMTKYDIIQEADKALYASKAGGRNRVTRAEQG